MFMTSAETHRSVFCDLETSLCPRAVLVISFAVFDNPEPLYLLELLGQTAFFGTPWETYEYPRYRFNWLNTPHMSDAAEVVM